jgi:hypothetical protein
MKDTNLKAVREVAEITAATMEAFRAAVGKRHSVAGIGTQKGGDDLYFLILRVEGALAELHTRTTDLLY